MHPIHNKKLIVYSHGLLLKGCVPKKMHLNNILKISTLGLARVVVPKNFVGNQTRKFLESKSEQLFESHTKTRTGEVLGGCVGFQKTSVTLCCGKMLKHNILIASAICLPLSKINESLYFKMVQCLLQFRKSPYERV